MPRRIAAWSLRRRLAAIALFACTATLAAAGAGMYRADHIADEAVLDARLIALAHTVLAFAEHEIEEMLGVGRGDAIQDEDDAFARRYHYQIWTIDGERLLLHSHKALLGAPMRPIAERGFGETRVDGHRVRTYSQTDMRGSMVIQVAERKSDRLGAVGTITGYFFAFLVVPLLLIFFSSWWFLNRALHSVDGYAAQLRERPAHDLTALDGANPPEELKPMVDSINVLLARFRRVLTVEREFTAFAAHELRTPLAGLRAHAQLAASLAGSPQELEASLRALMTGIDQATHLLDRLLDLARIDSLVAAGGHALQAVRFDSVYRGVMAELGPVAAQRRLALASRFELAQVQGIELGLALLLHNLLINAIRYTPAGGRIEVGSTPDGRGGALLTVDDSGPGIPAGRHAEAFQRFNRLGRVDAQGVGLGLSIVQAVAQAHHAVVRLHESHLGGLRVEVHFPAGAAHAALRPDAGLPPLTSAAQPAGGST